MKRRITFILALVLCLSLSACGKEKKTPVETQPAVPVLTEAPTEMATVPPMTEAPETVPVTETTVPVETTEATEAPTEAPTEPEETEPVETEAVSTSKYTGTPAKVTGYYEVNLRKGPSTDYEVVKKLKSGTDVTVVEYLKRDGATWCNLGDGWMTLKYLKLDGELPETPDPALGELATVYQTETLNVRMEANAGSEKVAELHRGDVVHVHEIRTVAGVEWGKIDEGWVSMKYILRESSRKNAPPIYVPEYVPPVTTAPNPGQPTFPPPEG